jgi:D-ala D-ala ligase C-terminus
VLSELLGPSLEDRLERLIAWSGGYHKDGFYSYDAKYVDADGSEAKIPADLPPETTARVRGLTVETFRALELAGMTRVEFFFDRDSGDFYVNEVNTIPGFTAISMYPKMSSLRLTRLGNRMSSLRLTRPRALTLRARIWEPARRMPPPMRSRKRISRPPATQAPTSRVRKQARTPRSPCSAAARFCPPITSSIRPSTRCRCTQARPRS